jgi:Ca2+-binding RTX toxin-like protein
MALGFYTTVGSTDTRDGNNSFSTAQYIGQLGSGSNSDLNIFGQVGEISFDGIGFVVDQVDYFRFDVSKSLNVAIISDDADATVRLYDDRQRLVGRLSDFTYGGDYAQARGFETGLVESLDRGTYYLRVSSGAFINYEIDLEAESDDDFQLNQAQRLGTLNCSERVEGTVGSLDLGDAYRFRPGRAGLFVVGQTADGQAGEMQLYEAEGDLIESGIRRLAENLRDDRDYFLRVLAADPEIEQDYSLTLIPNPVYEGTARADRLRGCADDETFRGLAGDDVLIGQKGNDQLLGGAGNDRLFGDNGDDRLDGGRGVDVVRGGRGRDTFALLGNSNADRILDFQPGLDRLDLPNRIPVNSVSIVTQGRNSLIQSGNNLLATLVGVPAARVTAADFV